MNEASEGSPSDANIYIDKKFMLIKQIGEGGFGGIFLCQDISSRSYCAIKINRMNETQEIESEIELMNHFDHPNVLSIIDYSIKKGVLHEQNETVVSDTVSYMVMPLANFGDLGRYLRGDYYFEEPIACYIFQKLFYGISHIHDKGYVHLDIKPDNILITKEMDFKIGDFGLSQPSKGEDGNGIFSKRRCGTKSFWSPEIALGFEYNGEQADLYSLAIMLFIIVFGCRPFREIKTDDPLFMKLLKEPLAYWMAHPYTRNRIKERTVSEEVVDLLARMLMVNPESRLSKSDITKHPWFKKYNEEIYSQEDEEFQFASEILDEEDDDDFVPEEDLDSNSDNSEDVSLKSETDRSQSECDVEAILEVDMVPSASFISKVKQVLTSIRSSS